MRLLDLGCGSGAAAAYLASRRNIEIVCVTNSSVQADICRRKFAKLPGRGQVIVTDFDSLDLLNEEILTPSMRSNRSATPKDLDAWLARCFRADAQAGRTPANPLTGVAGSLSAQGGLPERHRFFRQLALQLRRCQSTFVYKLRRFSASNPIRYRRLPFWAWGLTWNFIQHLVLWKYRLKMRTFVELERIIWRTSKVFVFGNPYNTVLATKPEAAFRSRQTLGPSEAP